MQETHDTAEYIRSNLSQVDWEIFMPLSSESDIEELATDYVRYDFLPFLADVPYSNRLKNIQHGQGFYEIVYTVACGLVPPSESFWEDFKVFPVLVYL